MNVVPDRTGISVPVARLIRGRDKAFLVPSPSPKNMTTTVAPSGSGEPNTDLDSTRPSFDVYQAYQRALADEEVSLPAFLTLTGAVFSSRHPDISPSSGDSISHGACNTF
jgi:hypothetical protein